jgi:hypothetical protein
VSEAPLDPASPDLIDWLSGRSPSNPGAARRLHPDFGPLPYGVPYVAVPGSQERWPVAFVDYPEESDAGAAGGSVGYPIPDGAARATSRRDRQVAERRPPLSGDRPNRWLLQDPLARESAARAEAGWVVWNLATNTRRPDSWTSRRRGSIFQKCGGSLGGWPGDLSAFRFTARATDGYVWPASHAAGDTPGAPPMGTRLRLKASTDLSQHPPEIRRIFQAMKTYGLILADNGSDLFVTGTMDARWDNEILNPAFHGLTADDFEVIRLGWDPDAGE